MVAPSIASLALTLSGASTFAATASNARSPLGMNLQPVNYYTNEQPFLNIFKTTWISKSNPEGWQTHRDSSAVFNSGEGQFVQTDENGYPTTLTPAAGDPDRSPFSGVGVIFLYNLGKSNAGTGPNYPAGLYVVLYDGQGTLSYGNDAKLVSSSPGRDVFNATPTYGGGIDLRITATDPHHTGNHLRNIRVVKAEQENLLTSGGVFNPIFLGLLQNFRVLRGMQWLQIDDKGGLITDWSQRPHSSDAGWGGPNGTPVEALVELCNATGADCWLNIPHAANDDYIAQMAKLAHALLGSGQKAYVELSNEVWNSGYAQFAYANAQGRRVWPNAGGPEADYGNNWYGMRVAQTCDIWKSVWGADASRVVCVMGASAAVPWTATEALNCELWKGRGNAPCSGHGIGAVAIAPYFAYVHAHPYWTTAPDGGLKTVFLAIDRGDIQTTSGWEAAYQKTLAPYHLPMITYEGGQTLVSSQVSDPTGAVKNLYIAANRDPRMGEEYTKALNDWKANGGQIYTIYADINKPGEFGEWGALESVWDTVTPLASAPPKWQAIQNFIAANPCWWPNCVGTIGNTAPAISAAPTNPVVK